LEAIIVVLSRLTFSDPGQHDISPGQQYRATTQSRADTSTDWNPVEHKHCSAGRPNCFGYLRHHPMLPSERRVRRDGTSGYHHISLLSSHSSILASVPATPAFCLSRSPITQGRAEHTQSGDLSVYGLASISNRKGRRMTSSGQLRRVAVVRTDVSEELAPTSSG
jgi:hypothetical protein